MDTAATAVEADRSLERSKAKLDQLVALADGHKTFLAQTHDYPDPDTIASALGLTWLMEELTTLECQIGYGGVVGRAENRAMVKVLSIKLKKLSPADIRRFDLVALLDTQPECTNHSIPPNVTPDIVVDHHFMREIKGPQPPFLDIGGDVGSTSTKITQLVRASGIDPPVPVATALFYGVKSDTLDLCRVTTPADVAAYLYLFERVDRKLLQEIEHPQVPLDYFRVFNQAIEHGKVYGSCIVADLGDVYTPDLCAELADRLLQVEGIKHALSTGWYEGSLCLSLRSRSKKFNAGRILYEIVEELGYGGAGGHRQMAGAQVPMMDRSERARADTRRRIVSEVLTAYGEDKRHFHRIMTKTPDARGKRSSKKKPSNGVSR